MSQACKPLPPLCHPSSHPPLTPNAHRCKKTHLLTTSSVLLLPFRSHARQSFCLVLQAVHQSSAVLGLGLIGMAEDLGNAMAHRALEHLLQYGDTAVRSVIVTVTATAAASCSTKLSKGFLKGKLHPSLQQKPTKILVAGLKLFSVFDVCTFTPALCGGVCSTHMCSERDTDRNSVM